MPDLAALRRGLVSRKQPLTVSWSHRRGAAAPVAPWPHASGSEVELQADLDNARIGGALDETEFGKAERVARGAEKRSVGGVEELASELEEALLVRCEHLVDGEIA